MTERTAHKKYFRKAAFSWLVVMVVLFYGCKQLSHTEKDNHDFEVSKIDSTAIVNERIVDTITLALDSIPSDTVALSIADSLAFLLDSLAISDSLTFSTDSLQVDSLRQDTVVQIKPRRKSKRSESAIETKVICSASDSSYRDMNKKKIYYFGNAEAKYDDITLKADYLEFDLETITCIARGITDSLGKIQGRPVFTQGESTF